MNEITENAVKAAKKNYRESIKDIVLCRMVTERLKGLLPEGWIVSINTAVFRLELTKGYRMDETDAIEFKTVVKIIESITGGKLTVKANVSDDKKEIYLLRAEGYVDLFPKRRGRLIGIEVTLWNPKKSPDCEITFKRKWTTIPVISENCLGIKEAR